MENTNNIPTAYEGKEPYIFVSYAHKDSEKVVPVVQALKDAGFRVWYDEGLVQGENYHEDIAEHIALCTTALVFLSSVSANSTYCKMEIEYAFSCGKKLSVVYLEENVVLSPGIQLLLNSIQSLMYGDYESNEDFMQALFQTPCLQICAEKDSLYFSPDEKSAPKKKIIVSPLHEHVYTSEIVAATCIARGYTVHKCTCGYEYKDTYTSLAGHKYVLTSTKEPTCTELGCTKEVCTVCGEKKVTEIPAKGHTFEKWIVKTSPTCTVAGKKIRQCSECGYVEEQTLSAKGHQWSPTEQRLDEHGNKEYVSFCKLCGEEKVSKETEEERKAKEAQAQLSKKSLGSAIASGITALYFFVFMIINFAGGEKIGWGIIFLLIAFACGGASVSFAKEFIKLKPPLSEEEKARRKKKIALILIGIIVTIIIVIVIAVIVVRNNPKSQFEYTKHWRNDYVTIQGIKNESYAINNGTVEIPSKIDGMEVGLGSLVFEGKNFTTLILPKNLQEIFSDSLDGCIGLKNIVYKGAISDWNSIEGVEDIDISKYSFTHEGECQYTNWTTPSDYNCEIGGTSTRSCEYCKKTDSKNIEPAAHNEVTISTVPAKCESTGLSEGKKCSVCNKILQEQTTIEKLGHTEVVDKSVEPTCTKTGLTAGSHCSFCKQTITKQNTISAKGHKYSNWSDSKSATCTTTGEKKRTCSVCSYEEKQTIQALGHSYNNLLCIRCNKSYESTGFEFTETTDGYVISSIGTCTDTNIIIPEYYNGKPIVEIADYAFAYSDFIKSIYIPTTVKKIGRGILQQSLNVESMTVPFIGNSAAYPDKLSCFFQYSGDMYNHAVPSTLKKVVVLGGDSIATCAFRSCSVEEVWIKNVTSIGENAFLYCDYLQYVNLENVKRIGKNAFDGCANVKIVEFNNGINAISASAFASCVNLEEVRINSIEQWLNIEFEDQEANPLYHSNFLLVNGQRQTSIAIPNGTTAIKKYAFVRMADLVSIILPSTLISIGDNAFFECVKLVEIINHSTLDIEANSNTNGCVGLHAMTIHNGATKIQNQNDFLFIVTSKKTSLLGYVGDNTNLVLPTLNNTYEIHTCAFYQRKDIKNIEIPNCVTLIGEAAFYQCEGLTTIKIPNSVTTISYTAFHACRNLVSVELGTGVKTIGDYAFAYCHKLVEVINHSTLNIEAGVTKVYGQVGANALIVHTGNSLIKKQNDFLFYEYGGTVYLVGYVGTNISLTLPNKFNNKMYSIYEYAFAYNENIKSVTISNGVSRIEERAFQECINLSYVFIGNDVTYIGRWAFTDCNKLVEADFANASGWWYSSKADDINGTNLSSSSIKNTSTAANYLVDEYDYYYWHKD